MSASADPFHGRRTSRCSAASDCTSSLDSVLQGGLGVPFLHESLAFLGDLLTNGGGGWCDDRTAPPDATLQEASLLAWQVMCPKRLVQLSPKPLPVGLIELCVSGCWRPASAFGDRSGFHFVINSIM